ncbi:MAG: hypothetical protein V5A36_06575 [Natronomonas sp.]
MDTHIVREILGDTGVGGIALTLLGLLVLARENRRGALGALAIISGSALLAHGLVGSFLDSMGMEYEDLY